MMREFWFDAKNNVNGAHLKVAATNPKATAAATLFSAGLLACWAATDVAA
jgi:hypothetical protein